MTRVKALRGFVYQGPVAAGDVVEVPASLAVELIANAKAVPASEEPKADAPPEAPRQRRRAE